MAATEQKTLYCSFCGKSQHEVKKLIAGPTVFICDECTLLCLDILVEENFHPKESLNREQRVLAREHRIGEILKLLQSTIDAANARHRPYALLQQKLEEFSMLHGSPANEATSG